MDIKLIEKLDVLQKEIGNTPIVNLQNGIYGKLESANPAGSIKDRAAYFMVRRALESGALKRGEAIVEATSGNTGIGLAYIAHCLDIKCVIVMPESMSEERRNMISKNGAQLVLTPASLGMDGAVCKAKEIAGNGGWLANQFGNAACVEAHFLTTAPEIFESVQSVKYVIAGIGSGGTAMGIKRYIEQNYINCRVIGVEPSASPLLCKGCAGAHKIQGIGANFIPDILEVEKLDGIFDIADDDAIEGVRRLYKQFGVKCGISSGAAYMAALRLRENVQGNIVTILPDGADRYDCSLYE